MKLTAALLTAYASSVDLRNRENGDFNENQILTDEDRVKIREDNLDRTPIIRALAAKQFIQAWFDRNCKTDETDPDALRPERCSKKYERVFVEWDSMERAFLQPCGFFDPEIYQGGPPRKVDRLRARRDAEYEYKVPHELDEKEKRNLLKDLKFKVSQLRNDDINQGLEEIESEILNEDYWDYFEEHEREFSDVRPNKKKIQMNQKMEGIEINLKKAGGSEHSPREAIEFLMNQMKQYSKRYISMCPAQINNKAHSARVRKIRRGLEELAADMEVIKLEKYERQYLKEERRQLERLASKKDSKDVAAPVKSVKKVPNKSTGKSGGPKRPTNDDPRNEPRPNQPGRVRGSDRDDSGNLLLDLVLSGAVNKEH